MTTDTVKKEVAVEFELGGVTCRMGGIAKGSGMIHPNLGTMLVFITTDAAVSPAMLDKAIRDDPHDPTLYLMRFERLLDALAAAPQDDRRRWRDAAEEDLVKLHDDPGPWSVRIALGAARLRLLDGQTALARAELAGEAIAHPAERRILAPLVALDAALGMPEARAEHLAALRRADPAAADAAADAAPDPDTLFGITLEEELFAAFPEDRRAAEFEGAVAIAARDPDGTHRALLRAFGTAALAEERPSAGGGR